MASSGNKNINAKLESTQTVAVNDATVKFEIWDTAGQEIYHSLAPVYYRGEILTRSNPNMVMVLAGNKSDQVEAQEQCNVAHDRVRCIYFTREIEIFPPRKK